MSCGQSEDDIGGDDSDAEVTNKREKLAQHTSENKDGNGGLEDGTKDKVVKNELECDKKQEENRCDNRNEPVIGEIDNEETSNENYVMASEEMDTTTFVHEEIVENPIVESLSDFLVAAKQIGPNGMPVSSKTDENDNCRTSEGGERSDETTRTPELLFRRPNRRLNARVFRVRSTSDMDSSDEEIIFGPDGETSSVSRAESEEPTREMEDSMYSSTSNSSISLTVFDTTDEVMDEDEDDSTVPRVLAKPKPRHKWFVLQEVINRQMGSNSKYVEPELFQQRCYGSLHCVKRLELMYKLETHRGCVNALNFNQSGTLLTTASDDKKVGVWNWALGKCLFTYDTGHTSNVFQAKFLPLSGDRHIVTCARDGQVRLSLLTGLGESRATRQLAAHKKPAHKIAIHLETPHVFLSAGEDAVVYSLDVREHNNKKLLMCKEGNQKIALYSIHSNPLNSHEFCVAGEEKSIRLYDRRKVSSSVKKFCPQHLLKFESFIHITSAVFNYNGSEILASYNDDDIYLFDTKHTEGADYVHRYEGHRNSVTVKGVNFFGPRSEYVVSGSDCGNIYFWDKHTESIVQWMRGDEEGVVNCLEPHPKVPIIATSGLDYDVKIWVPSCEQEPTFDGLKTAVSFNQKARDDNRNRRCDPWDNHMQWLWRQIRRFERRRSEVLLLTSEPSVEENNGNERNGREASSSSEEEESLNRPPECAPS